MIDEKCSYGLMGSYTDIYINCSFPQTTEINISDKGGFKWKVLGSKIYEKYYFGFMRSL